MEGELGCGDVAHIEVAGPGGFDHRSGSIDAGHDGSRCGEFLRECAIAAANIEDALSGFWGQEINDAGREVRDEPAALGISGCVPGLAGATGGCEGG